MSDYDEGYRAGMQKMREVGHARIEELEAKLAMAVEALEVTLDCIGALSKPHELYGHGLQENEIKWIFATLAELKGKADE